MELFPLKKGGRKTSVLWEHATKVFHENGSVKHIKCIHCGKTSYGGSTSNALKHLKSMHFNHLNSFMDSKNRTPHTYELKCEMKQKLEDGIETGKTQKDYDDDAGPLSKYLNSSNNDESVRHHPIQSRSEDNDDNISDIDDDNAYKDDSDVESGNDNSNDDRDGDGDDDNDDGDGGGGEEGGDDDDDNEFDRIVDSHKKRKRDDDNDDDSEEAVEDWNRVVNKYKVLRKKGSQISQVKSGRE